MHKKNTDIVKTGWRKRKDEVTGCDILQDDYQIERGINGCAVQYQPNHIIVD
jgi:hypothetical protein